MPYMDLKRLLPTFANKDENPGEDLDMVMMINSFIYVRVQ